MGAIITKYLLLFFEFFKAGLFSIGGGLATLPFLKQMANNYPWFTPVELTNMIAISESTPGPMGVNISTYAGFKTGSLDGGLLGGIIGAFISTSGLVLPSIIIIICISKILEKFRQSKIVDDAFYGLRPASAGLILGAMFEVFVGTLLYIDKFNGLSSIIQVINFKAIILFAIAFICILKFKKIHPIVFIILGGICGIIFKF